jgi:DNA-3-methyladenine glycosylase I
MESVQIVPYGEEQGAWAARLLEQRWGATQSVSRGVIHQADRLSGFVALLNDQPAGLATYQITSKECELVTLDSLAEGKGVGSALIQAVIALASQENCRRVWLITTNDNLPALRYYQRRGFQIKAVYPNALELSRKLKPQIPLTGLDGIPLRDEIELEYLLD